MVTVMTPGPACAARSVSKKPSEFSAQARSPLEHGKPGGPPSPAGLEALPQPCPGNRFRCTKCTAHCAEMFHVQL